MIRNFTVVTLMILSGCVPFHQANPPTYAMEWPSMLRHASLAADSGNYANADRVLTDFAAQYPRTREAHEILFWRALYKLDPGNKTASITDGLATLDKYLADTAAIIYRPEASVIKRLAVTTQVLQAKALTPALRDTTIIRTSNEAEISQLKEQLAKTNAELERIKKRLANPNK